jgi:hypothetical protein
MLTLITLITLMTPSATKITLYTHTACPFAQRVWIALEHTQVEFVRQVEWLSLSLRLRLRLSLSFSVPAPAAPSLVWQDVNLYGSGGFDKRALKQVEERGGLQPPKGYIPVLAIGDDLFRESDHCVRHCVGRHGRYSRPARACLLGRRAGPRLEAALSVT